MRKSFKKIFIILFLLLIVMIFVPLIAVKNKPYFKIPKEVNLKSENLCIEKNKNQDQNYFNILDNSDGKIIKVSDKDFLYGAVACEMPANFEKEALKAQTVASYTYFSREREISRKKGKNYDFTANTKKWINYMPENQMKIKWNNNFQKHYEKIKQCVNEVFPQVIEDDGDLILAVYHAISSGKTEKCEDVFGKDLKYLTNVESPGDKLAQGYESTFEIEIEKFKKKISDFKNINFEDEPSKWVKSISRTGGGMVKEIKIGDEIFKGQQIRNIFGLRSSDFEINYIKDKKTFLFNVKGYGHGVGMSQIGAQYMASHGYNYKKILSWYYPNTSISKFKNL